MDNLKTAVILRNYLRQLDKIKESIEGSLPPGCMIMEKDSDGHHRQTFPIMKDLDDFIYNVSGDLSTLIGDHKILMRGKI